MPALLGDCSGGRSMLRLIDDFCPNFTHLSGNGGALNHQREFCVQAVYRQIDHFCCDIFEVRLDMRP